MGDWRGVIPCFCRIQGGGIYVQSIGLAQGKLGGRVGWGRGRPFRDEVAHRSQRSGPLEGVVNFFRFIGRKGTVVLSGVVGLFPMGAVIHFCHLNDTVALALIGAYGAIVAYFFKTNIDEHKTKQGLAP